MKLPKLKKLRAVLKNKLISLFGFFSLITCLLFLILFRAEADPNCKCKYWYWSSCCPRVVHCEANGCCAVASSPMDTIGWINGDPIIHSISHGEYLYETAYEAWLMLPNEL